MLFVVFLAIVLNGVPLHIIHAQYFSANQLSGELACPIVHEKLMTLETECLIYCTNAKLTATYDHERLICRCLDTECLEEESLSSTKELNIHYTVYTIEVSFSLVILIILE